MLVSIIIPYYNDKENISSSVSSAIDQSYKNTEIIIVDDENSKQSNKLLSKFKHKKIKLIKTKKNSGVSFARNLGIKKSNGNLIAFLDSDDLWKKNKLKNQLDIIKKKKIDFCYTDYYGFIDKNIIYKVRIDKKLDYSKLLKECPICCSSTLIKKEILLKNRFRNLKTKEDYELWLRLAKKKYKFYGINKLLTGYRIRKYSLSNLHLNKLINSFKIYCHYNNINPINSFLYVCRLYTNAFVKKYF